MGRKLDNISIPYEYNLLCNILRAFAYTKGMTFCEALFNIVFERLIGDDFTFDYSVALFRHGGGMKTFYSEIFEKNQGHYRSNMSNNDLEDVFRVMAGLTYSLNVSVHGNPEQAARFFKAFNTVARLVLKEQEVKEFKTIDDQGRVLLDDIYNLLYDNWPQLGMRNETYEFLSCLTEMIDWSQLENPGNRYEVLESIRAMVDKEFYGGKSISGIRNHSSQEYTQ